MLTVFTKRASSRRSCDGISRGNFIKIGARGMGGLALPQLLKAKAPAWHSVSPLQLQDYRRRVRRRVSWCAPGDPSSGVLGEIDTERICDLIKSNVVRVLASTAT